MDESEGIARLDFCTFLLSIFYKHLRNLDLPLRLWLFSLATYVLNNYISRLSITIVVYSDLHL